MLRGHRKVLIGLVVLLVLSLVPAGALAQTTTIVLVNPPSQSVQVGQNATVDVKVDGVASLYGVDIRLSFDAAKLEVLDADGNAANGVQIASGDLMNPAQGFLAQNTVNNTTGQVQYVFALMAPAAAVSGSGALARITFKTKASGNAVISLDSVTLSSEQAQPIPATLMDGAITVLPGAGPTPVPTPVTPQPTLPPGQGFYYTALRDHGSGHRLRQRLDQSQLHPGGPGAVDPWRGSATTDASPGRDLHARGGSRR
jgi:hypothetical protein